MLFILAIIQENHNFKKTLKQKLKKKTKTPKGHIKV